MQECPQVEKLLGIGCNVQFSHPFHSLHKSVSHSKVKAQVFTCVCLRFTVISNAADAGSQAILVETQVLSVGANERQRWTLEVQDDGHGISSANILHCGKAGWSSKATQHGSNRSGTRGFRGQALAAIVGSCKQVQIESTVKGSTACVIKRFVASSLDHGGSQVPSLGPVSGKQFEVACGLPTNTSQVEMSLAQVDSRKHGTTVHVKDPFYQQPVRLNHLRQSGAGIAVVNAIKKQLETQAALQSFESVHYKHNSRVVLEIRQAAPLSGGGFSRLALLRLLDVESQLSSAHSGI